MICRMKVRVARQRVKSKNACQCHKNENFEKNVRYIKESDELSMPAKNQGDWVRFGDRMAKNQNWPFSTTSHISIFLYFHISTQDGYFCMDIQDKGSF